MDRAVDLGVAADEVVQPGLDLRPVAGEPGLSGLVAGGVEDLLGVLALALPAEVVAAPHAPRGGAAPGAGADCVAMGTSPRHVRSSFRAAAAREPLPSAGPRWHRAPRAGPLEGASFVRAPSGYADGRTGDAEGRLISGSRRHRCLLRTERGDRVTRLAGRHGRLRLDAALHPDGSIRVADPLQGIRADHEDRRRESERPLAVHRLAPGADEPQAMAADVGGRSGSPSTRAAGAPAWPRRATGRAATPSG